MRIAVYHNQPSGGARRALHGFCRELVRHHVLRVYTLTSADREMLDDDRLVADVTRFAYVPRPPVRGGLYLNDLRRRANLDDLERLNREVARRIDADGHECVLVDACRFTFAPYVLRYLRTPTVYYCHHRPRLSSERQPAAQGSVYERARRLWHLPLIRSLERRLWSDDVTLVRRASKVVTNSVFNQERIAEVYGVAAAVCPPGVDLPSRVASGDGGYVLAVGELELRKGHDLVIRALGLLPSGARPPLHIVANGGDARVRADLERLARSTGVDLLVRILPPQRELDDEYSDATAFLTGACQEPLGLAPLEAMAHGVPVVAVAEGGLLETVVQSETGYLVPRDAHAFSERLASLLGDPARRKQMGAAARAHVEARWTWPERAPSLERELESAIRQSAGQSAAGEQKGAQHSRGRGQP